jgi:hypothetical protein
MTKRFLMASLVAIALAHPSAAQASDVQWFVQDLGLERLIRFGLSHVAIVNGDGRILKSKDGKQTAYWTLITPRGRIGEKMLFKGDDIHMGGELVASLKGSQVKIKGEEYEISFLSGEKKPYLKHTTLRVFQGDTLIIKGARRYVGPGRPWRKETPAARAIRLKKRVMVYLVWRQLFLAEIEQVLAKPVSPAQVRMLTADLARSHYAALLRTELILARVGTAAAPGVVRFYRKHRPSKGRMAALRTVGRMGQGARAQLPELKKIRPSREARVRAAFKRAMAKIAPADG